MGKFLGKVDLQVVGRVNWVSKSVWCAGGEGV